MWVYGYCRNFERYCDFLNGCCNCLYRCRIYLGEKCKKTTEISTDLRVVTARCDTLQQLLEEKKEELEQVKQAERDLQSALLKEKEKMLCRIKIENLKFLAISNL